MKTLKTSLITIITIFLLTGCTEKITSFFTKKIYLKQTGQNTIYIDYDDAYYQSGQAISYTKTNNTIKDNTTTLIWQDNNDKHTANTTHKQATTYCKNLTLDNKDNWRLPSISELLTLIDYSKIKPSINNIFTNTKSSHYWSSTMYKTNKTIYWGVDFKYGDDFHKEVSKTSNTICVSGENKIKSNLKSNKNTIINTLTNLQYQDNKHNKKLSFEDAIIYCNTLSLDNHNDWRLPNINELSNISNKNIQPSIESIFKNTNLSWMYWSSTTDASSDDYARAVWFSNGGDWIYPKSSLNYTRCVRSIK